MPILIIPIKKNKAQRYTLQKQSEGELLIQPSPWLTFFGAYSTKGKPP